MTEDLQFIYRGEYWYMSAFLNTVLVDGEKKSAEIANLLEENFKKLNPEDIFRQDLKDEIIEMVNNISINCQWVPFLKNFPIEIISP